VTDTALAITCTVTDTALAITCTVTDTALAITCTKCSCRKKQRLKRRHLILPISIYVQHTKKSWSTF